MAVNPENFFNGNGSTTLFSFTFEYLEESDVKVSVDGVVKTQTTDYTFANATTISFNTAPASGTDNIRIYRDTDVDELKATFFPGSAIRASDLNDNLTQNNYAVQEIKAYTWDNETDTIHSNETWVSSDTQIATTAAMDQRFQDEVNDTLTKAELAALSDVIPDNDDAIPTTGAVKDYVDHVIETDILVDGTGLNKTGSGGQVTLGISANSVDFDRIKDSDIITDTEQDAGSPAAANTNIFTALGAARRFDTIVSQAEQSSAVNWEVGKTWLQNDAEKTVRIWDGSAWIAVASGGAFTTLPKVVYVDSVNGDDDLEGHRISNPKRTIKAAIEQINSETDAVGDGSVVIVAPGVYQEAAPIDIQKKNVSIIGQALRSCIVHPTVATQENTLFRLNSGSYVANLTLTGIKASGTRGGNSLDTDATHGLPTNQGWNFAFFPGATIVKSPYIANCTNFSDSEIDNSDLNAFNPRGGLGGDTDSAPTGGGILVDGSAVSSSSPLRSMVCDSYTHVGLDGPGIFVTNNGYCQATSSYAFFTHYHIKTLNGGQANLAASTTDFGRFGLIASGKSSSNIFSASSVGTTAQGATTITIGTPSAHSSWHGSATRPQSNMLLQVGGNVDGTGGTIYSIIGATANGTGWDVQISNPDPDNLSTNLGFDTAVSSGTTIRFFLMSMIASSGHTMEYVGSGTNYSALPENGGVPIEANEIVELNDGKVWAATTNHQGKFTVGSTFNVDQVTGYVNIANGAIGIEQLIEDLDLNSFTLSDSTGDVTIDDQLDMNTHKIVNVVDPTSAQDAATKNYVDTSSANTNYVAVAGDTMSGDLTMDANIVMNAQSDVRFADSDSSNWVAIQGPATIGTNYTLTLPNSVGNAGEALITDANGNLSWSSNVSTVVDQLIEGDTKIEAIDTGSDGELQFTTDGTRAMTIDNSQRVGIGTASPGSTLSVGGNPPAAGAIGAVASSGGIALACSDNINSSLYIRTASGGAILGTDAGGAIRFATNGNTASEERVRIDTSGRLLLGSSSAISTTALGAAQAQIVGTDNVSSQLSLSRFSNDADRSRLVFIKSRSGTKGTNTILQDNDAIGRIEFMGADGSATNDYPVAAHIGVFVDGTPGADDMPGRIVLSTTADGASSPTERLRITSNGNVGIGSTSPGAKLQVNGDILLGATSDRILTNNIGIVSSSADLSITSGSANLLLKTGASNDERVRIDTSGRLGLGTSSPSTLLHIQSTDPAFRFKRSDAGTDAYGELTTDISGLVTMKCDPANAAAGSGFRITVDNTERLRIDSSGRVGIGTTSVNDTLEVSGSAIIGKTGTANQIRFRRPGDSALTGFFGYTDSASDEKFEVRADGGAANVKLNANNATGFITFDINSSEKARLDSSGRLLVGTSSTSAVGTVQLQGRSSDSASSSVLRLNKGSAPTTGNPDLGYIVFGDNASSEGAYIFGLRDGGTWTAGSSHPTRLSFSTTADGSSGPTERMRIRSSGVNGQVSLGQGGTIYSGGQTASLGIGGYTDGVAFGISMQPTANNATPLAFQNAGGTQVGSIATGVSSTSYNTTSDYRLKENVVPLTGAANRLNQLQVHRFNFIEDPDRTVDGFLAHEAQAVVPEAVTGTHDAVDDDGNPVYQGIDQSKLVPLLTAALQEALAEIESLKVRVAALEA